MVEDNGDVAARVKHTIHCELRFPSLVKLIDKAVGVQAEFAKAFAEFAERKANRELAQITYAGFVTPRDAEKMSTRSRNVTDELVELFEHGRGNRGENFADVFSGLTDYYTNVVGADDQKRFTSSEFGGGAQRKREFFELLRDNDALVETQVRGSKLLQTV
jgi:hypothetical protein